MATENISVIRLRDLLLVTVPPDPDDQTISALQEQVLQAMARHEGKGLVLDISTVQTLDSFFARTDRGNRANGRAHGRPHGAGGHARQRGRHRDPTGFDGGQRADRPGRGPGFGPAQRRTLRSTPL